MIVQPDFLDHWKTRLLVDKLDGDEVAPLYLLRLWAHCQNRRTNVLSLTSQALKAICHYSGRPDQLEEALLGAGYLHRDGEILMVHQWDAYNAGLIASWSNGGKGGRPRKPQQNPAKTPGLSTGSPAETDKSRVDKKRHDERGPAGPQRPPPPPSAPSLGSEDWKKPLNASGAFKKVWRDWKQHLAELDRHLTKMQETAILMECARAGPDRSEEVLRYSIRQGAKNPIWDAPKLKRKVAPKEAEPDPPGWMEWLKEEYPRAFTYGTKFQDADADIQTQFRNRQTTTTTHEKAA